MTNKYIEKIASLADIASKAVGVAKQVPGVLRTASGTELRGLQSQQSRAMNLAGRAEGKAKTFGTQAAMKPTSNQAGYAYTKDFQNKVHATPRMQTIADHNASRSEKLKAHAAGMQGSIDSTELATRRARSTVGKVGAGVAVAGIGAAALSKKDDSQGYY
jgi:hypothetical protein